MSLLAADFASGGALLPKTKKARLNQMCTNNQVITFCAF